MGIEEVERSRNGKGIGRRGRRKGNTNDAARLVTGGWMPEWTMMKCDSDNDKAILSVADNLRRNKMSISPPTLSPKMRRHTTVFNFLFQF